MKKSAVLGIMALTMAISTLPMNVKASEGSYYQIGNSGKVIVLSSNCDLNQIKEQIENGLNSIIGNIGNNCIPGDSENNGAGDENIEGPIITPDHENEDESTEDIVDESYAQQVVNLVNEERAKEGLSPLTIDENVVQAANVRAVEIQSSFSHTRPNGSQFSTVLKENGVTYRGSGENIAYGQKTPEQVVTGWMNSAGHRANIMNPNFKNIGVGYQVNSNGTAYWVQLFTY